MATRPDTTPPRTITLPDLGSPRQSYRELIGDALRAALTAGEMAIGSVYSVPALAEQFGVSATPVREAMLDLVKEQLLEPVPNKGFRVLAVSDEQLNEYTQLRELIEVPVTARLAVTADRSDLEALRPRAEEIVAAAREGDLLAYLEADIRFHTALLELAGNRHLVEVVRDLRRRSRLYGLNSVVEAEMLEESAAQHLDLLSALLDGDAERARAIMAEHVGQVRTKVSRR
ncbi:GntR family transcriptional regulator [Salininema proteolyticum]|uniref:GntR family transcriptional regulator n=1 Tax=Salininema proteolyticum TaxID=1607685 RepID=A0ABV8U447_9ACTN